MGAPTYFVPYNNVIMNITNADAPVVTTYADHGYKTGLLVRLYIPISNGMGQLSSNPQFISIIDNTNFQIFEDTSAYDPFIPPILPIELNPELPQSIAVSELASTLENATQNNGNILPETLPNPNT
jgi:hypothetical protein